MNASGLRVFLISAGLLTVGLSGLVWRSNAGLESARLEVQTVSERITAERVLLDETPALEQEVLVYREISGRMAAILPDEAGLNDLVRSLQVFSERSGVEIRSLRRAAPRGEAKRGGDLRAVSYTLELEGDAFELLSFLDLVETNDRFLRIPRLEVDAARRQELLGSSQRVHSIRLDVETFVFEPGAESEPVPIEWADWKLDQLRGEVSRRRTGLEPAEYEYRGRRGRRDPWVDPRHAPAGERPHEGEGAQPEEATFAAGVSEAWASWRELEESTSAIEGTGLSEELEVEVVRLEAMARSLLEGSRPHADSSERMLTASALDSLKALRAALDEERGNRGPSIARLKEVSAAMREHAERGQHDLVLEAIAPVEADLEWLAEDVARAPYVASLQSAAAHSRAELEFDAMGYTPRGVVVLGERAAALVGEGAVMEGQKIKDELFVHSVTSQEVVFEFRGVLIKRRVPLQIPGTWER